MAGRKSKILKFGIVNKVEELRNSGLTFQQIADKINSEILSGDEKISKDTVCRHYNSLTKQTNVTKPIELLDDVQQIFRNIYFNIDTLKSIDSDDKRAIKDYIRGSQRALESKLNRHYRGLPEHQISEFGKVRKLILDFSRDLCIPCRKNVVENVLKIADSDTDSV